MKTTLLILSVVLASCSEKHVPNKDFHPDAVKQCQVIAEQIFCGNAKIEMPRACAGVEVYLSCEPQRPGYATTVYPLYLDVETLLK
jgi:hypothetical protein